MSFDSGPLDRFLHSAVGDDLTVAAELHATFVHSAKDLADLMQRSRCDANWSMAALRLKSLAATFGVIPLIQLAERAMAGAPGDPAVVRDIRTVITDLN
jgi:hypothetical protein